MCWLLAVKDVDSYTITETQEVEMSIVLIESAR